VLVEIVMKAQRSNQRNLAIGHGQMEEKTSKLKLLDQAVTVPSPATHAIGDPCKQARVVVSIGVNARDGETLYNTQLLFDSD
jgi:nitrilase